MYDHIELTGRMGGPLGVDLSCREIEGALLSIAAELRRLGKGTGYDRDGAILQLADAILEAGRGIALAVEDLAGAVREHRGGRDEAKP